MSTRSGKLVVGQSGGCTAVINCSLVGVIEAAARADGVSEVLGAVNGVEGLLQGRSVRLDQLSPERLERIALTPSAALGSCRYRLQEGDAERIVEIFRKDDVRSFIYIGGNDSAQTALAVARAACEAGFDLNVVGVPKTIDNDLPLTDHCPGYGSAARFLAAMTLDSGMDTESMVTYEPVKVIETMGRHAGWLTSGSVLGKRKAEDAPHIVWPPEIPFEKEKFLGLVESSLDTIGHATVVVSENIRYSSGEPVGKSPQIWDAFGHPRVVDTSQHLCDMVAEKLGVRARWDKPGTLQRMSTAHFSSTDVSEAREAGRRAATKAIEGATEIMITLTRESEAPYRCGYAEAQLEAFAGCEHKLPPEYFDLDSMLPTAAFVRYALPLIGDPLPEHERLDI